MSIHRRHLALLSGASLFALSALACEVSEPAEPAYGSVLHLADEPAGDNCAAGSVR